MIKVPEINNASNNQKDSNLNLGKTNSMEKQLNDQKIKKKREEYYWSENNFQSNTSKENITTEKGK